MTLSKAIIRHPVIAQICFWIVALLLIGVLWQGAVVMFEVDRKSVV